MGRDDRAARLLRRLDAELAAAFQGRDRVVLAFSGGLASLLLAALARKRGRLECVVVGTQRAADAEAALVAKSFLDYPVAVLRPSPAAILRAARSLASGNPAMAPADVLALVPLVLVTRDHPKDLVLTGFGLSLRSAAVQRYLAAAGCRSPGLGRPAAEAPSRSLLLRAASELAVPDAFTHAARRTPAEGSGVGPALRAAGHTRHVSLERLLRGAG